MQRYSPNFTRIAVYAFNGDPYRLVVLEKDTATIVSQNIGDNVNVCWSPNSRFIAYIRKGDIVVYDLDSKTEKQVTHFFEKRERYYASNYGTAGQVSFSPDNNWLAFTKFKGEGMGILFGTYAEIYIVDINGQKLRRVVRGNSPSWGR